MAKDSKSAASSDDRAGSAQPLRSMTGYGEDRLDVSAMSLRCEIRSVNNRYLDLVMRLPKGYQSWEPEVRALVGKYCTRGRVEVTLTRTAPQDLPAAPHLNRELYDAALAVVRPLLEVDGKLDATGRREIVLSLLSRREIFDFGEGDADLSGEHDAALGVVESALKMWNSMREKEGEALAADMRKRFQRLEEIRVEAAAKGALTPALFKERLMERVKKIAPDIQIDEQRFAQEVVLLSDRVDVTEETVRLQSHLSQAHTALGSGGQGRKLDFILQECGREFNTITSKCQQAEIQSLVVEAKVELEKIREQVQNIE